TRCRCVCPSVKNFATTNNTSEDKRRYYTEVTLTAENCNPTNVVKATVAEIINESHIDAFLANCDCKYESRNTVLLKVVVIFVIFVVLLLCAYMGFLMFLDPMLKRKVYSVPYRQQTNDSPIVEDNIFARGNVRSSSPSASIRNRPHGVIERVEAEQNKWSKKVEEQRKTVFTDHTMLN
uniref:TMEM9 protein n=1 Tax=Rhabditophanes sp. KR3021 TaxID=114890 RepID=A0AC35THB0_9BILA